MQSSVQGNPPPYAPPAYSQPAPGYGSPTYVYYPQPQPGHPGYQQVCTDLC